MRFKIGLYNQVLPFSEMPCSKEYVHGIAIRAYDDNNVPYANVTVNLPSYFGDFCEFIGFKNCAYVDTNNCPRLVKELEDLGIARDTGFRKTSGFCDYPLYEFDEEFLRSLPEITKGYGYEKYLESYNKCMQIVAMEMI